MVAPGMLYVVPGVSDAMGDVGLCSSLNAAAGRFSGVPRARECLLWATLHGRTPGVLGSGLVLKFSKVMENASFIL